MGRWVDACDVDAIDTEDVVRFDHGDRTFAIYRGLEDDYYCTDGLCSHENVHLADGLVMDNTIECPKHGAAFDIRTGEVLTPPACVDLTSYPVKVEGGRVMIALDT